ncbi:hypothetical protein EV426DRAFT_707959 [Tirmania nivea]|nr:hypothetical protein EV426DRAFT_707959 [Tirmania nivea]
MIKNIQLLKKIGMKRLILDMSNNAGGLVILGMETIRRFFSEAEPFYGVDYRCSPFTDFILKAQNVTARLNQINGKPFAFADNLLNPPVAKRDDYSVLHQNRAIQPIRCLTAVPSGSGFHI